MLVYLTTYKNSYRINFTKFLSGAEFGESIRSIKRCKTASFIETPSEKFWTIDVQDVNILKKEFPDLVIVNKEYNSTTKVLPQVFAEDIPHLDELKLILFPYQLLGVSFLLSNNKAILGDEMGLGKTPQFLSTIYVLFRQKKINHALIVCPNSIKFQIYEEVDKFFDAEKYKFTATVINGTVKKRLQIYENWKKERPVVTIINYELLNQDLDIIKSYDFDIMVCDEAHKLRKAKTISHKSVNSIHTKILHLSTGTPFSKEPVDVYNLFKLLDPKILGPWTTFSQQFLIIGEKYGRKNCVLEIKDYQKFHEKIAPFMLRRLKKDVASCLPPLTITNRYVEMTKEQERIDEIMVNDFVEFSKKIKDSTKYDADGNIISQDPRAETLIGYQVLRHCVADSLDLLRMGTKKLTQKYAAMAKYPKKYVPSPKIKETLEICTDAIENNPNQKIVIFTEYERMQRLLYAELSKKFPTVCVNGSMNSNVKNKNIKDFKTKDINILIGTNSINYGINLQESNLCICVDQGWLPDTERQRHGRIHRINTAFDKVTVINLVSLNSIDENIIATLQVRQEMGDGIIENKENENDIYDQISTMLSNKLNIKRKK